MQLRRLVMTNFMSTGTNVEVPLDLPGLVLVSGDNQDAEKADSNGSGKSSIFGGITYALWGKVPCPPDDTIEADDVVHDDTGKDCRVELWFDNDNGSKVRVVRTRKDSASEKPNDLLLEVDGVGISASTNEMTQDKINGIFGMDYETFCTLMPGLGQEIASMTDSNIKELLEKILRTEELSLAHDVAKEKYKALEKDITSERAALVAAKDSLNQISIRLVNLRTHRDHFSDELQEEITACKEEKRSCAAEARAAKAAVEKIKAAIEVVDAVDLTSSAAEVKEAKESLEVIQAKLKKLEVTHAKKTSALTTKIQMAEADVLKFQGLNECPTCLSCVDESHKETIVATLRAKIVELQNEMTILESSNSELTDKLSRRVSTLTDLVAQRADEHNKLVSKQRELESLKREFVHAEKELKIKIQILRKVAAQLDALSNKTNNYANMVETEEAGQRDLQAGITVLLESLRVKLEELALYEFWVKAYSPSGIRSHMMENVVPYLNDRAQYYCDRITSGEMSVVFNTKTKQKTGKIVDKFKIEVSQKHGCKRWKGSSKGERARAALVIALALGDLASMRASKKLSFRAIDEMLDPIDGDGDEAIVSLLRDLEAQFGSVYLITHKDRLKGKFERELIMQKKNGFTTLKGVFEKEVH